MLHPRHEIRFVNRSIWTILAVVLLGLSSASCARSPQVVILSPQLAGPPGNITEQRRVELRVRDERNSKVIGSRGGTYAKTSTISTEDDISPKLAELIGEQLERQGYTVVPSGSGGEISLDVALQELTYETGGSVLTEIKSFAAVGVTCKKGNETLTSRYSTNHKEEFATAPDEEENSELINMVVGKSINAMLGDQELREFMSK